VTESDDWKRGLGPRVADEVGHIKTAFHKKSVDIGIEPEGRGVGYIYAPGELLVLEQNLPRVINFVEKLTSAPLPAAPRFVLAGLAVMSVTGMTVPEILREMDRELGEGYATPNHMLTVAQVPFEVAPCEPVEPAPVPHGMEPCPSVSPSNSGAGVRVYVSDTGLLPDAKRHPWLTGVTGDDDKMALVPAGGDLGPYFGHGTFVAGVLRCMAPAAGVHVSNAFSPAGSAFETDFIADLQEALRRGADIIHVSATGPTRKNMPLLSFSHWRAQLAHYKGTVCVAAAGNSGGTRVSWPAASADVVSVGALASDWRSRASFSNHGGWVDVYAPGRDLINAYTDGTYVCQMTPCAGEPRNFYGMARRSGTSFSAAIVTGLIAARMWRTGENAAAAAAALLDEARSAAIPGVGAIVVPS
jgi:hypothetical protein